MLETRVLNSLGKPVILNDNQERVINYLNTINNALGFQIDITTLTAIQSLVTEQKFYKVPVAEYCPIKIGNGAWQSSILTYKSFDVSGDFETGVINTGTNNARVANTEAAVTGVPIAINNWAKGHGWTIFDLQMASKSGNWDVVRAKEVTRKRNWDLGIQRVTFLGLKNNNSVLGILNQAGVTINTTLITQSISSMADTPADLSGFLRQVLEAYRANCSRSAMPNRFVIPESDYLGLATPSSPEFPLKSVMQLMLETFQVMTGNADFKILPSAYGDPAESGQSYYRYALYNAEEESLRMDIPVDYTNTLASSMDAFSFQNVGYGQFTGALAYRPAEMLYFQYSA